MPVALESNLPQGADPADRAFAQLLLEALPSCALVIDPEGRIAAANSQAERTMGWRAEDLEGRNAHEVLGCRVEAGAGLSERCPIDGVLNGSAANPQTQMRVRCRDDSMKPVEYGCVPYPTARGRGAILVFHDLTRQIELEKDLRRLASIAEASPIAIVELNEDANLTHANPAMVSLLQRFGFSSDARPAILPAGIQKLTAQCWQTQAEIDGIEVAIKGSHYEWKLVPVTGEKLVRGYGIDISARKRMEIELLQAKVKAESAAQAKSEFLANTKHEIHAPARVISGAAAVLAETELSEEQHDYVKTIQTSAEALTRVIDNILEMATLAEGATRFDAASVDFRLFMDLVTAPLARQAEAKGLRFSMTVSPKVPAHVVCDRSRLTQILTHLINNAIKFTERGHIIIEVDRDTITSEVPDGKQFQSRGRALYLFFSVRDSGIGIPQDKQKTIFDSFAQADGAHTRLYGGNGLGLAIAKQMLALMGGIIGVESEPGRGSRFWFSLPTRESDDPSDIETHLTFPDPMASR